MAIQVNCACGKQFRTKDENAGRRFKCPVCGDALTVPKLVMENSPDPFINPVWANQESSSPPTPPVSTVPLTPQLKNCPYYGEEIQTVAKKCKHCGEFLDPSLKEAREVPKWNPGIAALLSLIVPGLGQMYKGQVGMGILQVVGWIAAIGTAGYAGLVLNVASFLHAALAKPKQADAEKKPRSIVFTFFFILAFLSFLFIVVAVLIHQKEVREDKQMREDNVKQELRKLDNTIEGILGR